MKEDIKMIIKKSMWTQIANWLNTRKTSIATIIGAVLVYALGRHWIAQDTAQLITMVMAALGVSVNAYNASERAKGNY